MSKKQWYNIYLTENGSNKVELLAKVKSKGLANLTVIQFAEIYEKVGKIHFE
jgi:fibronectin type 3 domain-containing protein